MQATQNNLQLERLNKCWVELIVRPVIEKKFQQTTLEKNL